MVPKDFVVLLASRRRCLLLKTPLSSAGRLAQEKHKRKVQNHSFVNQRNGYVTTLENLIHQSRARRSGMGVGLHSSVTQHPKTEPPVCSEIPFRTVYVFRMTSERCIAPEFLDTGFMEFTPPPLALAWRGAPGPEGGSHVAPQPLLVVRDEPLLECQTQLLD